MTTLDQLEQRITQLEAGQAAPSTSLAPNYLTVDPATGAIGANFTGQVHAMGLDLDAATSTTPPSADKIRWIQVAGGAVVAELVAYADLLFSPSTTLTQITANPDRSKLNGAAITLAAQGHVSLDDATLTLGGAPLASSLTATAGGRPITLLDYLGRSSCMQVAGALGRHVASFGASAIQFGPPDTNSGTAVNIAHGLPATPNLILVTPIAGALFGSLSPTVSAAGPATFTVDMYSGVAVSVLLNFFWLAIT